ncbi:MAG: hypothetical protein MHPSP_002673, partial [Paramarteilia canceri]
MQKYLLSLFLNLLLLKEIQNEKKFTKNNDIKPCPYNSQKFCLVNPDEREECKCIEGYYLSKNSENKPICVQCPFGFTTKSGEAASTTDECSRMQSLMIAIVVISSFSLAVPVVLIILSFFI